MSFSKHESPLTDFLVPLAFISRVQTETSTLENHITTRETVGCSSG